MSAHSPKLLALSLQMFCTSEDGRASARVRESKEDRARCFRKKSQYVYAKVLAISKIVEELNGLQRGTVSVPAAWVERVQAVRHGTGQRCARMHDRMLLPYPPPSPPPKLAMLPIGLLRMHSIGTVGSTGT